MRAGLAAAIALQLWAAMASVLSIPPTVSLVLAALCAALAVFGLPSVSPRAVVWVTTVFSGAVLVRFGTSASVTGVVAVWPAIAWLAATAVGLSNTTGSRTSAGSGERASLTRTAPTVLVACVALMVGTGILVGPRVASTLDTGSTVGETLDSSGNHPGNPLDATSSLDMTTRPQLSDRVVMTVSSPVASFWRSEVFDQWDG
ncbi:MAG: hypothetical protein ACK5O2_15990, partial [Microthrixaceae bacterium]